LVYTWAAKTQLDLSGGSIEVRRDTTAYDTAKLGGTKIEGTAAGSVTFDASAAGGTIGLSGAVTAATGGKLTARGTGGLKFTNTRLSTGAEEISLPALLSTGIGGDLILNGYSVLTISGDFNVGTATASALLAIGGNAKIIPVSSGGTNRLILVASTGKFDNGKFTLTGVASGTPGTFDPAKINKPETATTIRPIDLVGAFGAIGSSVSVTGGMTVTPSGSVTIALGTNNSITTDSELYSSN
jgi:hypothetical protein